MIFLPDTNRLRLALRRSANLFLNPFTSLPFDDLYARRCRELRAELEAAGNIIGPHDLQIAAIALQHTAESAVPQFAAERGAGASLLILW
jgi:predicted nucleic acid-binding protein